MKTRSTERMGALRSAGDERSPHSTGQPVASGRTARAGTVALLLGLSAFLTSSAWALPDTQAEIEAEILAKKRAGGGRVVVAPGVIEVFELRVPSTVTLVGSGAVGTPKTTLRLRPRSEGGAVTLGGGRLGESSQNAIENIIIDGNRQNQAADRYITVGGRLVPVPRPAVLTINCSNCAARYVRVLNAMYDGVQVSASQNVLITNSSANVAGRYGFFTTDSVITIKVHRSTATNTGVAWKYLGGGAGFAAGGKNVEFRYVTTRNTNGDGVAAYASTNLDIKVLDSIFYAPKNHCVHLGGDRPVIARNKCYDPRLAGYYLANNWRAGFEEERDAIGGRVLSNYVEDAGTEGVHVQWYIADTLVQGNTVNRTFNHNYEVNASRGVTVSGNVGRWPGTGRSPGSIRGCHLKIDASQVSHFNNNFSYPGRTNPLVC